MPDPSPQNELRPATAAKGGEDRPLLATAETGTPKIPIPADQLTPEEQMRLFEKELKEKDWGHQPC